MPRRTIGYVELEWSCPNCNTRNPGPQKTCQNCGAPQPENVQFELPPDQRMIAAEQATGMTAVGPDIHCGFCGARNRGDAKTCTQCGGDLAEGRRRAAGRELTAQAGPKQVACTNCGTVNPASRVNCSKCGAPLPRTTPAPAQPLTAPGQPPKKKLKWGLFAGIGAGLLTCCAAIYFLFLSPTSSVQATVTDVYWQTSVAVQEQREVRYTDQASSPPADAYDVSCRTESEEVCEQKTIDRGDGYAEVVEECYTETQEYCSYTVLEWETVRAETLEGSDFSPLYAQPNIAGGQRLGDESVTFTVYFDTEKGDMTYSPDDLTEFRQFQIGSTWTLQLNMLGGIVSVQSAAGR